MLIRVCHGQNREPANCLCVKYQSAISLEEMKTSDGYPKATSEAYNLRAAEIYSEQARDVDIVIPTGLIPGAQRRICSRPTMSPPRDWAAGSLRLQVRAAKLKAR